MPSGIGNALLQKNKKIFLLFITKTMVPIFCILSLSRCLKPKCSIHNNGHKYLKTRGHVMWYLLQSITKAIVYGTARKLIGTGDIHGTRYRAHQSGTCLGTLPML